MVYVVSSELYHHGILGQKWGVRRFQNPDGSLTEAGKARYLQSNGELTEKGKKKLNEQKYKQSEHNRRWEEEGPYYYLKEKRDELLKAAKENDEYSMDYLEIAPESLLDKGGEALYKDYEKFLKDPEAYLNHGYYGGNELYHHGIKGQRWGVRRFQNPDGTLTEAGKKRYGTVENFEARKTLKKAKKEEVRKQEIVSSGKAADIQKISSTLTAQEMEMAFKRIDYETKLANMRNDQIAVGREKIASITSTAKSLKEMGQTLTDAYNLGAKMYNAFNKSGKKLPIIGEKKETQTPTEKFNLEREKVRWQWEQERHERAQQGGSNK